MTSDDNVRTLRPRASRDASSAELLELLGDVVEALDEIGDGFERIDPGPHWSAARWSAESMPFCMRLIPAEEHLAGLRQIDTADWPDIDWSIDLSNAHADFEHELRAVVTLLDMLLHYDMSPSERAWQTRKFTSGGKGFLEALQRLREVIVARHPQASKLP